MFGEPPPEMRQYVAESQDFEIWPENEEPLSLFLAVQTQWRVGFAGPTGLDYSGVEAAFRFMDAKMTPELFGQFRLMEKAALDCMTKAN